MGNRDRLTAARVREVLEYNPQTGVFTWKVDRSSFVKAGQVAGSPNSKDRPYWRIRIDRKLYVAHRIAWLITYGQWPTGILDHVNGDTLDNRIANLREATTAQNGQNSKLYSSNSTGFKGVSREKGGRFRAEIRVRGRRIYLGTFDNPKEAHAAYCAAGSIHHGEFFNSGEEARHG